MPLVINKTGLQPLSKDEGLKKLNNIIVDIQFHIKTLGIYGGHKGMVAHMIQIERMKKHCDDMVTHQVLSYVQTMLCIVMDNLEKHMQNYSDTEKILHFSSEKVSKHICILPNEPFACIV